MTTKMIIAIIAIFCFSNCTHDDSKIPESISFEMMVVKHTTTINILKGNFYTLWDEEGNLYMNYFGKYWTDSIQNTVFEEELNINNFSDYVEGVTDSITLNAVDQELIYVLYRDSI